MGRALKVDYPWAIFSWPTWSWSSPVEVWRRNGENNPLAWAFKKPAKRQADFFWEGFYLLTSGDLLIVSPQNPSSNDTDPWRPHTDLTHQTLSSSVKIEDYSVLTAPPTQEAKESRKYARAYMQSVEKIEAVWWRLAKLCCKFTTTTLTLSRFPAIWNVPYGHQSSWWRVGCVGGLWQGDRRCNFIRAENVP